MNGEIKHGFEHNEVKLTDGSVFWEVATLFGERIASFQNESDAEDLEIALNMALTDASEVLGAATCAD